MHSCRSRTPSIPIARSLVLAFGLLIAAPVRSTATNAIVLTDLGVPESTIPARMQELGWQVTTARCLEVQGPKASAVASADVFWVTASSKNALLENLVKPGGVLDTFARQGGIVVVTGVNPDFVSVAAAPGGVRATEHTANGEEAVNITDATHPVITGAGIGGVVLTNQSLDPTATGANGCIAVPPAIQGSATVIASDAHGPAIIEYPLDAGRVILSTIASAGASCTSNLLLYLQSLRP
jgi:hypothetical protein